MCMYVYTPRKKKNILNILFILWGESLILGV